MSPDGYSTSVTVDGDAIAIQGSSFTSMGDVATKRDRRWSALGEWLAIALYWLATSCRSSASSTCGK